MDKVIYRLVYNRKKSLNRKGMALLQVEAYLRRKKKYFSTQIYLRPDQWDRRRERVRNHPNAELLNRRIGDFLAEIEEQELCVWRSGKNITLDLLKERLSSSGHADSFCEFFQREVELSDLRPNTKQSHLSTWKLLRAYRGDLRFSEVTFELICGFEHHLVLMGYHVNTVAKHMKQLKRYVNMAINKELMDMQQYAFRNYRLKVVDSKHTNLTQEELERLEHLSLNGRPREYRHVLDAFLFCCYTGLRYSDFVSLSPACIQTIQGRTWLIYRTVKTDAEVRLPLYLLFEGRALLLLQTYRQRMMEFFSLKDNSNVNKKLHIMARMAGIGKRISFHTARHTNATLLIYRGVNITTVQKLLGHRSVKTTQGYAEVMDMTLVHDLETHGLYE